VNRTSTILLPIAQREARVRRARMQDQALGSGQYVGDSHRVPASSSRRCDATSIQRVRDVPQGASARSLKCPE
jgi:hypothetical protein